MIVVDGQGTLLADSAGTGLRGSPYADRAEIAAVLDTGRAVQGKRRSDTLDQQLLFTAVPDRRRGSPPRRGARDAEHRGDRRPRAPGVLALAAIGAAALVFGLALAWVLAGSLSRPLRGLAGAARRAGAGDLDARAPVEGPREQREVASAFNQMVGRLGTVLAAQREFVGNASHQLRTPLTGLRLRLEAASLRSTDPELERDLAAAEQEVVRLSKLLDGLLTLAREGGTPPSPQPVDLSVAAAEACDRWLAHGREIELTSDGPAVALASESDVATILDSFVENALAYSTAGAPVAVEWGIDGGAAYVAVLDRGPGIAPGEEEAVFERFRRGEAGRGGPAGTGLGLAIARTLAARWGGTVTIGNRPGGGARAELRLPAGEQPTGWDTWTREETMSL